MLSLRLYFLKKVDEETFKKLVEINEAHNISYKLIDLSSNGEYDQEKERQEYNKEFKSRAKILRKRTDHSINILRSRKAHNYFISSPSTIAIIGEAGIEWYSNDKQEIKNLLMDAFNIGEKALRNRCT